MDAQAAESPTRPAADAGEPFSAVLRRHRLVAGLTQEALAERAGLGVRTLQGLEEGEHRPRRETGQRLAAALGLPAEQRAAFAAAAQPPPRASRAPAGPVAAALPAGTVTFLFTDLEGSTRLLQADPRAYRDAVAHHHVLLRDAVEAHGGAVFETVGDAAYAAFAHPSDAVAAALAAQRALEAAEWGALGRGALRSRMAVHTGEVEPQGAHYFGAALYRAGRLLAAAHGGQVLLSEATATLVPDALPAGASLRALGEYRLRDLRRPERVHQLCHPLLPDRFPPLRSPEDRPRGGGPGEAPLPAPPAVPSNPFFHRGPVRDPAYFVGRAREMRFVADLLRQGQSVAVSGPRRLGKTSLLFHLAHPEVAAAHGLGPDTTRWVYLDGGALDGLEEDWLYGAVDRALGGETDTLPYPRFAERLRDLAARGLRLILAVDEFELVAANPHLGPALFNRLRALAAQAQVQFITASKDPLLDLTFAHRETLSSPFFNIFAPLHLGPLPDAEAAELLTALSARGGRPFGPGTLGFLLDLAGPHPLFLQIAGYYAYAALAGGAGGELGAESRAAVQAQTLADLEPHLRYYWSGLDSDARYTLAALPLLDPDSHPPALDRLAAAGLLRGRAYLDGALEAFVRRQRVDGLLQGGPFLLDVRRGLVAVRGRQRHLTPTEFAALKLLLERRGQLLTPEAIEAALWPNEVAPDPERARGVVKKLRAALGPAAGAIVNRRGQGYLLATD